MKQIFLLLCVLALPFAAWSQTESPIVTKEKLKVVFQLTSNDTLVQKSLVKQLNNFLTAAPNAKIEVVCHNNGISFLQAALTKQTDGIKALHDKGVDFVACANTLRERKIKVEELLTTCRTTPSGVVEIALKQHKGWAYLKAGF
jgi:intracellular sulfur oxidation DsrE/DsrF family protein